MNDFRYEHFDVQAVVNLVKKYYKQNNHISIRMKRAINTALKTIISTANVNMIWRKLPIIQLKDCCAIYSTGYPVKSRKLLHVLSYCDEVILFAATLGRPLDSVMKQDKLRMHEKLVLDQVASKVMEAVMEIGQKQIGEICNPGEGMTARYSPGHCDWPIEQQDIIFSLLPMELLGIHLSPSYLMTPRKSVTALIGIGDKEEVNQHGNACLQCDDTTCEYRRNTKPKQFIEGGSNV